MKLRGSPVGILGARKHPQNRTPPIASQGSPGPNPALAESAPRRGPRGVRIAAAKRSRSLENAYGARGFIASKTAYSRAFSRFPRAARRSIGAPPTGRIRRVPVVSENDGTRRESAFADEHCRHRSPSCRDCEVRNMRGVAPPPKSRKTRPQRSPINRRVVRRSAADGGRCRHVFSPWRSSVFVRAAALGA